MDSDLDGFGTGLATFACASPGPNYSRFAGDCDDADATSYPGALELCDGIDNDCDLAVDMHDPDFQGPVETYYADADDDGHGDVAVSLESCEQSPPDGYGATDDDCDDGDSTRNPTATEIFCDGIDQDCSGDSEPSSAGYLDADEDGYGMGSELCDDTPPWWSMRTTVTMRTET